MDSCWQNTPKEIVNYILKLACSRLIYRDNCYIEIGKIKKTECINKYVIGRVSLNEHFDFTLRRDGWYLPIRFNTDLYENGVALRHGIYFDYYFDYDNYRICYWSERPSDNESVCTVISRVME
jgi:hypothetical protein